MDTELIDLPQKQIIIGISGEKGVGKSTLAQFLAETYNLRHMLFADTIKRMLVPLTGLTYEDCNGETDYDREVRRTRFGGNSLRKLMQKTGDFYRGLMGPDIFLRAVASEIDMGANVVVSDARFENEQKLILDKGGLLIILFREDCDNDDTHISEHSYMKLYEKDNYKNIKNIILLNNNGTLEELYTLAYHAVEHYLKYK